MHRGQLDALTSYIASVVRVMDKHGDHSSNVRLLLDSKTRLEIAFGAKLPDQYPDLLNLDAPAPPALPDLL